jgi:3-oxoacyl-[acyl-carrier-protein] synthase-3
MKKSPRTRSQQPNRTVSIIGTGSYVPERVVTNADLEKLVETSDEWITSRTGIKERRIAAAQEHTSHMAAKAAERAMEQAGVTAEEIDLIIIGTITPDTFTPATACHVQRILGAKNAACFDISAACSGFLYAVEIAQQFIANHTCNTVLVIGADKLSTIMDWQDRNTCVLLATAPAPRFFAIARGRTASSRPTWPATATTATSCMFRAAAAPSRPRRKTPARS